MWPLIGSLAVVPPLASNATLSERCAAGSNLTGIRTLFCTANATFSGTLLSSSIGIPTSLTSAGADSVSLSAGVALEPGSLMIIGAHDAEGFGPFLAGPGLTVHFAGILIREALIAARGQWIAFVLPPYDLVCPATALKATATASQGALPQSGKGCPPPRITLAVPTSGLGARALRDVARNEICLTGTDSTGSAPLFVDSSSLMKRRPETISCPPACDPADMATSNFLSKNTATASRLLQTSNALSSSGFDLFLGSANVGGLVDSESPSAPMALQPLSGGGTRGTALTFSYSRPCVPRSSYPAGVVSLTTICGNATDPRSVGSYGLCYYGQLPNDCLPCPEGGLCPISGYKIWSRPGWWVENEDQAELPKACRYPSERCAGWDLVAKTTACGPGYTGQECLRCDQGYYRSNSGACNACPNASLGSAVASFLPVIIVGAYTALVGVVFAAICIYVTRKNGGTAMNGLFRALSFAVSVWISLNLVSTVARSAPSLSNDPSSSSLFLSSVFAALRAIQGGDDNIGPIPLACTATSPLLAPSGLMVLGLVLEFLWIFGLLLWAWNRLSHASMSTSMTKLVAALNSPNALFIYRMCAVGAALLFSVATNAALSITSCKPVVITLEEYGWLRGDGTAAIASLGIPWSTLEVAIKDRKDLSLLAKTFTVNVMVSQTEVVCGEGDHIAARQLAIATIIIFSLGFPLMSLLLIRFLAIPTVLRTTRIPEALLKSNLSYVGFGGSAVSTALARLAGSFEGADKGKEEAHLQGSRGRLHARFNACFASCDLQLYDEACLEKHLLLKPASPDGSCVSEWQMASVLGVLERRRQAAFRRMARNGLPLLGRRYVLPSDDQNKEFLFRYPESMHLTGRQTKFEAVVEKSADEPEAGSGPLVPAREDKGSLTVAPLSLDSCGPLSMLFCCCPAGACTRSYALAAQTRDDMVDSSLGLHVSLLSQPIYFFVSGAYRPSKFYALQLDWFLMVFVQMLNVWVPNGYSSAGALRARGAFIFLFSLALAVWNALLLPDALSNAQQLPLRVLILALSGTAALYSSLGAAAAAATGSSGQDSAGIILLAYLVLIICFVLPLVILWAFVSMLETTAKKERRDRDLGARAFQASFETAKKFYAEMQRRRQAAQAEAARAAQASARMAKAAADKLAAKLAEVAAGAQREELDEEAPTEGETHGLDGSEGLMWNPMSSAQSARGPKLLVENNSDAPAGRIYVTAPPVPAQPQARRTLILEDTRMAIESGEDAFAATNPLRAARRHVGLNS
jgi:hypothetical protein